MSGTSGAEAPLDALENVVVKLLERSGLTVAAGESCTGGLLAKRLTDIPGASKVFEGCIVAYSLQSKMTLLGLDLDLITQKGAVSREAALAMANGAREKFGADIGIGITGIAGPDSDTSHLEPGTVFIALTTVDYSVCDSLKLSGGRDNVRTASASHALDMLRQYLS